MVKNEIYTGEIIGYGSSGEGVIKNDGFVIFVPFAAKGEIVEYKVLKVNKNIVYAKLLRIISRSVHRTGVDCPVYGKCGGCNLMHLDYDTQLEIKRDLIKDCFFKIAHLDVLPESTVPSEPSFRYRNKLQLPIREENGVIKIGFFAPDSHRVVETDECNIQKVKTDRLIDALKTCIKNYRLTAYNESTGKGLLRHLVVKECGDEAMVILVINGEKITFADKFVSLLSKVFSDKKCFSFYLNLNKGRNNVILGEKFIKIYGSDYLSDEVFGIKYTVGPCAFMQVNDDIRNKIYQKVIDYACYKPGLFVIDAFCGGGLMSAMLAKKAEKTVGVEIVPESVENAKRLAEENKIGNLSFVCGACEDVLPQILKDVNGEVSVVLDPARKGLDRSLAEYLYGLGANDDRVDRIVYVSCNPSTLARDVGIICGTLVYSGNELMPADEGGLINGEPAKKSGFKVEYVCGFDMFAQTKGVETLCVLTRK